VQHTKDIDFQLIAPRCGGQHEAFEELCCQLARRTVPEEANFNRLHGAGGDGGVECFADLPDGDQIGWQAKYVFKVDSLLRQATRSLETALQTHGKLTKYILCFPFNLTGPTARKGRSGQEKFDDWCSEKIKKAAEEGRRLTIEAWPASKIQSLLLDLDTSGGIRAFFFNETILTKERFSEHLKAVKATAGPRYTPELNIETDLWKWFAAFERNETWSCELETKVRVCRETLDRLAPAVRRSTSGPFSPAWPEDLREDAQSLVAETQLHLDECANLNATHDPREYTHYINRTDNILNRLVLLAAHLKADLEAEHERGDADSPGFRQFMAEYMCSFPAANLDDVRKVITAFSDLREWLMSYNCSLAFEQAFVLTGVAGSGKTHGICDVAHQRIKKGLLTCVVFGHQFNSEPDPWTPLSKCFGLPITLGREGLLDALNSAAEASGAPLVICIDAINETRPLQYWRDHLASFVQSVRRRPHLRLCVTCRTSYAPHCLPEDHDLPIIEHKGFSGFEREACNSFFRYYDLEPPIAPILQPELSNPLYLKLICETLRARGLRRLPSGWKGLAPTIRAFLDEKERKFAAEHETDVGANIVSGSLKAIASAIVDSSDTSLPWSEAHQVVSKARPHASTLQVLEWLVREDLLIVDAPNTNDPLGDESVLRPAFERLGDFLIADAILARVTETDLDAAGQVGSLIHSLLTNRRTIEQNSGVISALSIIIPEKEPGTELPNLVDNESIRTEVLKITISSFPWRDPDSFSSDSRTLILEAFGKKNLSWDALDSALSISWRPSAIDAAWLDKILTRIPLSKRDAWLCGYLHERYESNGPVRRLIEAAFELPLDKVDKDIAERWATILLWFTAAADRRVKDWATRAVTTLFVAQPEIIPSVLIRLIESNDDEVRERVLLSCYGALILSRNADIACKVTNMLHEAFLNKPMAFDNALIRDHIRCIAEVARELGALPEDCDPEMTMNPIGSEWPPDLPSDEEIERLDSLPKLAHSCLRDDFFTYSLCCLRPWEHALSKLDMGKWILQRVAHEFEYKGSGSEQYDRYMLYKYGPGRAKPTWAERIGKKYQWIAMYQLASRLNDNVERERSRRDPEPTRTPLILLEERKLDPTLSLEVVMREPDAEAWWIGATADIQIGEHLSNTEWVKREDDLPTMEELLAIKKRNGQCWLPLVSYPSWNNKDKDADWNDPYRRVWINLQSYLIPSENATTAYDYLHRHSFFERRMPEGFTFSYGFAGEYPWAIPFNTEPEELYNRDGSSPIDYIPSWNELAVEWEYDATLTENHYIHVPARVFFIPHDLWWDSRDGYRITNGRTVFRDPSLTEKGPKALIADIEDLSTRLDTIGLSLIWILHSEKMIIGGQDIDRNPRRTFSQVAKLMNGGSVQIGERAFFED